MPEQKRGKLVGLTGNIGSGKSTVAALLVGKGAALIDADALAKEATEDAEVLAEIEKRLGEDLVVNGRLDRAKTAELVFGNEDARHILNSIIHPWVQRRRDERVAELRQTEPPLIVLDIPLLYENGLETGLDAVVVVNAPLDIRVERVAARSGSGEAEIRARDRAQMPLEEKVRQANFVIDNSGDPQALTFQVDRLWTALQRL